MDTNENGVPQGPPDEDRTPTQEDAVQPVKPPQNWVMPQPVFRQTSGYTPKGFVNQAPEDVVSPFPEERSEPRAAPPDEAVNVETPAAVSEQPDVLGDDPVAAPPAAAA